MRCSEFCFLIYIIIRDSDILLFSAGIRHIRVAMQFVTFARVCSSEDGSSSAKGLICAEREINLVLKRF